MTSINSHPTFNYTQPNDYRFSHDSVFLAQEVFTREYKNLKGKKFSVLDLCSGVGIVGMDFLFHFAKADSQLSCTADFLEVQAEYESYWLENKIRFSSALSQDVDVKDRFLNLNYEKLNLDLKYDLIIANPPYFDPKKGKLSPSFFKNRCRFFIDGTFHGFLQFMRDHLAENGRGYFLIREELKPSIPDEFLKLIYFPTKIRGTWLALMRVSEQY